MGVRLGQRQETAPRGMGIDRSQGLLGFGGHSGMHLSSTPSLGPGAMQGDVGWKLCGFSIPSVPRMAVTFGGSLEGPVL